MTLIIAGERSGVGKTTVTLALLAAIAQRSDSVQSFKVGPDYIDPMFHRVITGRPSFNLDPVLTSEAYVRHCYHQRSQGVGACVIEGVMGLFDGAVSGPDPWGSTAHVAWLLALPVVLVIDCSRLSGSVAAIAHGFRSLDPRLHLAGVVLNRVASDRHLALLKAALAPLELPIMGVLHRHPDITLPSRHLGLVPTAELADFKQTIDRLADLGRTCFDWSQLAPLLPVQPQMVNAAPVNAARNAAQGDRQAQLASSIPKKPCVKRACVKKPHIKRPHIKRPRIAIARDRAFSFYYPDNLERLTTLGAELVPWSPLTDKTLPPHTQGLYFGGGFPEMFAAELGANQAARQAVHQAIAMGIPTYAECGGLMYLCQSLKDFDHQVWPMVGSLKAEVTMGDRLVLGYRRAIAQDSTPMVEADMEICGHEFHRSHLTPSPPCPVYQLRSYATEKSSYFEGWASPTIHASYLHLQWGQRLELPTRFVQMCSTITTEQLS